MTYEIKIHLTPDYLGNLNNEQVRIIKSNLSEEELMEIIMKAIEDKV